MKIGILMAGHFPRALQSKMGNYDALYTQLLSGNDFDFVTYPVVDDVFPEDVHDCDGWLISGSRHGAYEDLPFIERLMDFVRGAYAARVPIVGICFGHQVIAAALGGKVEKYSGGWAIGNTSYSWGDATYHLNAWHQDQVTEAPPVARVLASNDFCQNAALIYGDQAFSVQAHPEFESDHVAGLAEVRAPGKVPQPLIEAAQSKLSAANDNAKLADMIAKFFKERRIA